MQILITVFSSYTEVLVYGVGHFGSLFNEKYICFVNGQGYYG